ncbi:hypothetical protein TrRE_jg10341 [Triparma retinervis]|uniref:Uncharacterized protein n=1 Tax=Triparma retinervis TaxID=2557542 RepID=A0A9W7CGE5_9STRA|nr:hypothetical protein TrRE_jg10341 [Triparma retinervis]
MGVTEIQKVTGNKVCVDCDNRNPDWASINLGVLMCLECSGSHRHIGVHISQVRSLKLDTECWQGEMLEFMCSVGNAAFNRSWEKDVPPWVVHPEEYPYMTFVREHYISQKYLYRKFLRKEVGDERVSGTFTDDIFRGLDCGLVQKKSANNHLTPWQARYLKFHTKNGQAVLAYYKDSNYSKAQGEIQLAGSSAGLVDQGECDKDHRYSFSIETSADSEHQGRVFLFSTEQAKDALTWVESIRRHSGQVSERSSKVQATPIMAGMELQRLQLKGAAAQIMESEGVTCSGEILQREAYSYGRWYKRWAAITETALFIFMEEGGQCFCAIPLRGAHLDKYIVNANRDEKMLDGSFGVLCALSHVAFDAKDRKEEWIKAIEEGITTITIGR